MTTSVIQLKANQANAQKSTGPVTAEGKQIVANNALKHGLFSRHLILSDENPQDYQLLLDGLQTELNPVGTLEQSLVERIAVSLWRQRRLVRSETAHIDLSNNPGVIASAVNTELNLKSTGQAITQYDLTEVDQEDYHWSQSIYEEFKLIANGKDTTDILTNMDKLKKQAPTIYKNLQKEAEQDEQTIDEYLKGYDNPIEYFTNLVEFCQDEIESAKQRPLVLEIAGTIRNKRAIIQQGQLRDALAKYQVMLDNELYKAIKALRETQAWRLDSLNGFVLEKGTVSGK
ncbi:MAG: hypothetical protein ACXW0Q_10220 [Methylovulum sp.]